MSTSIAPSYDLTFRADLAQLPAPFSTFQAGHFVRAAATAQPAIKETSKFNYSEMYVSQPLDLDYEEPNAVVESDVEFIVLNAKSPKTLTLLEIPTVVRKSPALPMQRRNAA